MSRKRNITLEHHIGNRVLLLRHAHELSLEQLASAIGLSYQQVQKYEKGENRIAASTLYQIAQYFDVSIKFFYQGYGENKASLHDITAEGSKTMNAINKISDDQSRKTITKHIMLMIKALDAYSYYQRENQPKSKPTVDNRT